MTNRQHVLLFPMPVFGHIFPLMELGRKISAYCDVTLAVSAKRVEQLRARRQAEKLESVYGVKLYAIDDGADDIDMDDPEAPRKLVETLSKIQAAVKQLVEAIPSKSQPSNQLNILSVDHVIVDAFFSESISDSLKRDLNFFHFHTTSTSKFISYRYFKLAHSVYFCCNI